MSKRSLFNLFKGVVVYPGAIVFLIFCINGFRWNFVLQMYGYSAFYSLAFFLSSQQLVRLADNQFDWITQTRKRVAAGIIGTLIISFVIPFVVITFSYYAFYNGDVSSVFTRGNLFNFIMPAAINITLSMAFHLKSFLKNWKQSALNEERLKTAQKTAELKALQQQIDPHFLFNSFNVLTGLIEEDPSQATKFVVRLSKVYRYVLEVKEQRLIELQEELNFLESYIYLISERFNNLVEVDINLDDNDRRLKIAPLSLQLLIENAVKHNAITRQQTLRIEITKVGGLLQVKNNKNTLKHKAISTGMGLKNIQKRYELLGCNELVKIIDTEAEFIVRIPLL